MLTRRSLLAGGALGGVAATNARGVPAPGTKSDDQSQSGRSSAAEEQAAKALEDIRDLMRAASGVLTGDLAMIRTAQKEYLKSHGKFPDFIEVGIDVWESAVNWHLRTRQPMQVGRMSDGRYTMALLQSNLVLRPDVINSYVGQPYDAK